MEGGGGRGREGEGGRVREGERERDIPLGSTSILGELTAIVSPLDCISARLA